MTTPGSARVVRGGPRGGQDRQTPPPRECQPDRRGSSSSPLRHVLRSFRQCGAATMAITDQLNWLGLEISGDVAGLTAYTRKNGRKVFYPAAPPTKPPSYAQILCRQAFFAAMATWKSLPLADRQAYRRLCDHNAFCFLGHNAWVYLCLTQDIATWETWCRSINYRLPAPW